MITSTIKRIQELINANVSNVSEYQPNYNVGPYSRLPVAVKINEVKQINLLQWGFTLNEFRIINAKIETIGSSKVYEKYKNQRCIVCK